MVARWLHASIFDLWLHASNRYSRANDFGSELAHACPLDKLYPSVTLTSQDVFGNAVW